MLSTTDRVTERGQILVYGAHHAVSDLQSLLLVAGEIDAELSGDALDDTIANRDIHLLIEAQQTGGQTGGSDGQVNGPADADDTEKIIAAYLAS